MQKDKFLFSRIGFAYSMFFVTTMLAQVLWAVFVQWTGIGQNESDLMMLMTMTVPMYIFAFPVFFILCKRIPAASPNSNESFHWSIWCAIIVVCIGVTYWFNFLGQAVMKGVDFFLQRQSNNAVQDLIMELNPIVIFIAAVVVAPIMEELMFRKLLIDRLYEYSDITAILVSGFMFGIAHGNFYQFFYAFALGVIFAYIYRKTGRVLYTILLHMMINFMGSIIPILILKLSESRFEVLSNLVVVVFGMGILFFMILSVILFCFFVPRLSLQPGVVPIWRGGGIRKIFLNPGMLMFIIGGAILFLV